MKVKIQEYIKNEKYYIVPTRKHKEYIGMNHEPWSNNIRFEIFQDLGESKDYLTPDINRFFLLNLKEIETLLKTMTLLWNEAKNNRPVHNRTFSIRCYGDYNIQLTLTKAENHSEQLILEKINKVKLPTQPFSVRLPYSYSKGMYHVLNNLIKNKNFGG